MKNDNDLFYTCSLIEFIGRKQKLKRSEVVSALGEKTLQRIYKYADVFHCEPIEKTAYDFITSNNIASGEDIIKTLMEVYDSWIDSAISNYNSDFYYQPRDYIRECYREGEVI